MEWVGCARGVGGMYTRGVGGMYTWSGWDVHVEWVGCTYSNFYMLGLSVQYLASCSSDAHCTYIIISDCWKQTTIIGHMAH